MDSAFDDVINEHINLEEIRRRVEDWKDGLKNLYSQIKESLPEGWEARPGIPFEMDE